MLAKLATKLAVLDRIDGSLGCGGAGRRRAPENATALVEQDPSNCNLYRRPFTADRGPSSDLNEL